ncbi:RNA polymerase sigma factor [Patescibacteria group bacterium]|nr:RNA polymerase sigma factor [Patescibacteria group bacterium]
MLTKKEKIQLQIVMTNAHAEFEQGLLRHAHFRVSDSGRCDDLVQDTFLKTWVYLIKAGKISSMKPFLYHVLNCLIIDEYRKKKSVSLDILLEAGFEPGSDDFDRVVDTIDGKAEVALIMTLPVAYQKIMSLRYIDDLSLSEIALETGLTKNLVAVKTHRGMEKLRQLYDERFSKKVLV